MEDIIVYPPFDEFTYKKLLLYVIPVTVYVGKRKIVLRLLVDTGAEKTVLTRFAKEMLNLETHGSISGVGVGSSVYRHTTLEKIEIGKLAFQNLDVLIGDLGKKFSEYQILGILGAATFQQLHLEFNYRKPLLAITRFQA